MGTFTITQTNLKMSKKIFYPIVSALEVNEWVNNDARPKYYNAEYIDDKINKADYLTTYISTASIATTEDLYFLDREIISGTASHIKITTFGKDSNATPGDYRIVLYPPETQDVTTYTKVDPNNDITIINDSKIEAHINNDEHIYVYKTFAANYFSNDWVITFKFNINDYTIDFSTYAYFFGLSDALGSAGQLVGHKRLLAGVHRNKIRLVLDEDGASPTAGEGIVALNKNTDYYAKILFSAGNYVNFIVYSDKEMTQQIDILAHAYIAALDYSNAYACLSYKMGSGLYVDVTLENLNFYRNKYYSSTFNFFDGWRKVSHTWATNPITSAVWTEREFNAIVIGNESSGSPDTIVTQQYLTIFNYPGDCECTLNRPQQISTNHARNIKMLNFWNGDREVYDLNRSDKSMVLTGTENGANACDTILCVRNMARNGAAVTISTLSPTYFNGNYRIRQFGWNKISSKPKHYRWILSLEQAD